MRMVVSLFAAAVLTGCPGLNISRPGADNEVVVPDAEGRVTIEVDAFGWELAPSGACAGRESCGHLVANLSAEEQTGEQSWVGYLCGEELEIEGATFTLDLDTCTRSTGLFTVVVYLHNDEHVPFEGGGVATFRRFVVED